MKQRTKALLIGWDAADWKIINKLIDRGLMPNLSNFVNEGVMGNISTLTPPISPMLWTSIATGKYADKHGIYGFVEPTTDGSAIQPISVASRKVKAIWNILNQNGLKSHVINWWPSHPAEPINGIYVSNLYPKVNDLFKYSETLPQNCVHPPELQELFGHLKMHPLELDLPAILPFLPKAKELGLNVDKTVIAILKSISEAISIQSAATFALQNEEWDFAANAWGLHDMHGNAAEWTRSAYKPYPYSESDGRNNATVDERKVVRGGSWYRRPHRATSSWRWGYPGWMRPYDVGFRVVIEDTPVQVAGK